MLRHNVTYRMGRRSVLKQRHMKTSSGRLTRLHALQPNGLFREIGCLMVDRAAQACGDRWVSWVRMGVLDRQLSTVGSTTIKRFKTGRKGRGWEMYGEHWICNAQP